MGYDFLAIKALVARGHISGVGRQIGVGKESDIFEVSVVRGWWWQLVVGSVSGSWKDFPMSERRHAADFLWALGRHTHSTNTRTRLVAHNHLQTLHTTPGDE